jgi:hypothetical protein
MRAVSIDDVDWMEMTNESGRLRVGVYCGKPGQMEQGPEAFVTYLLDPGAVIKPHFHDVDQFQIFLEGDGQIGRTRFQSVTVHYVDAYTPYGPIVSDDGKLVYVTLRAAAAGGHFSMPEKVGMIPVRQRRTHTVQFTPAPEAKDASEQRASLIAVREDGLRVESIQLGPDEQFADTVSDGGGRFVLVCAGTARAGTRALPFLSVLYVGQGNELAGLSAGSTGATLLLLQFARPSERIGSDPVELAGRSAKQYVLPDDYQRT